MSAVRKASDAAYDATNATPVLIIRRLKSYVFLGRDGNA